MTPQDAYDDLLAEAVNAVLTTGGVVIESKDLRVIVDYTTPSEGEQEPDGAV